VVSVGVRWLRGRSCLTNCNRLDVNTFLEVSVGSIISILALEDLLPTEGVDEGCTACTREGNGQWLSICNALGGAHTGTAGTTDHQTELNTLLDILLATELYLQ
jgi:hypothetical protein